MLWSTMLAARRARGHLATKTRPGSEIINIATSTNPGGAYQYPCLFVLVAADPLLVFVAVEATRDPAALLRGRQLESAKATTKSPRDFSSA
jgi:hypothetical protein